MGIIKLFNLNKMSGICSKKFVKGTGKPNTEKLLIIGPSNSGKTTLAVNLIVFEIKPFSAIVFIIPKSSWEDEPIQTLKHYCKEAEIPLHIVDNVKQIPEIIGGAVFVIDDHYTSSNRNPEIEKLLMETVNRGRKIGVHILYIAQDSIRIPSEIKNNNTGIFLSGEIINQENLFKRLRIPEPIYKPKSESYKWYEVGKKDGETLLTEIEFPEPESDGQIVRQLKKKKKGAGKYLSNSTPIEKRLLKLEDAANIGNNAAASAVVRASHIPSPLF